jgi:hypothetical protein
MDSGKLPIGARKVWMSDLLVSLATAVSTWLFEFAVPCMTCCPCIGSAIYPYGAGQCVISLYTWVHTLDTSKWIYISWEMASLHGRWSRIPSIFIFSVIISIVRLEESKPWEIIRQCLTNELFLGCSPHFCGMERSGRVETEDYWFSFVTD